MINSTSIDSCCCCWVFETFSENILKELIISYFSTFISLLILLLLFFFADSNTSSSFDFSNSLSFNLDDLTIILTFSDFDREIIKKLLSLLRSLFYFFIRGLLLSSSRSSTINLVIAL